MCKKTIDDLPEDRDKCSEVQSTAVEVRFSFLDVVSDGSFNGLHFLPLPEANNILKNRR